MPFHQAAASFALLLASASAPAQDHYQVEFSKSYSNSVDDLNVNGVNSSGVSVGFVQRSQKIYEGTAWSQERTILLVGPDEPEITWANGINDADMIVGYEQGSHEIPCLWQTRLVCTPLKQLPGSLGGIAYAITNAGTIVGINVLDESNASAVVWKDADAAPLLLENAPGQTSSQAFATNDAGLVVGSSGPHAVEWAHGQVIVIPDWFDEPLSVYAIAIDAAGEILSIGTDARGGHHAALLADRKAWKLPGLPGVPSYRLVAAAMNGDGVVVGYGAKTPVAVRWSGPHARTVVDLNDLIDPAYAQQGWTLQAATAISADGHIAGNAINANHPGLYYRFTLTPG